MRRGCDYRILAAGILLAAAGATPAGSAANPSENTIVSVSPSPGSLYVQPATTIAVRLSQPTENTGSDGWCSFVVHGSVSGRHEGSTVLADERNVLIFQPTVQFSRGEEVRVEFTSPRVTGNGSMAYPLSFTFAVAASRVLPPFSRLESESSYGKTSPAKNPAEPLPPWLSKVDTLPLDFPVSSTQIYGPTTPGLLFLSNFSVTFTAMTSPYLMILTNQGAPVFYRRMGGFCTDFKVQPNGLLTYFDGLAEKYYALDSSYVRVDSFQCGNGYGTDDHDLRLLPVGHALIMSDDPESVDMSAIVPGGKISASVIGLIVQELDASKNVVFQWRSWDHFQITDATHENLTAAAIDYVHGNAIDVDGDGDGNLIVSCRHMDEITKIDRLTGQILWRWGGKNNSFTFVNDSLGFSHQHAIRRLPNGHFTLFDNGNFHSPPFSRAVEYAVDESARVATLVWQYRHSPDLFGFATGYVQRFDNGNTLICWGTTNPNVTEVTADNSRVYELTFEPGMFTYRAYRFEWPLGGRSAAGPFPVATTLSPNYPNPFNGQTTFVIDLSRNATVTMEVFDILGRKVKTLLDHRFRPAGIYQVSLDLGQYASGVYLCRLLTENSSITRKIILTR